VPYIAKAIQDKLELELKEKAMRMRAEGGGFGNRLGSKLATKI
jgi:hypothetical protein